MRPSSRDPDRVRERRTIRVGRRRETGWDVGRSSFSFLLQQVVDPVQNRILDFEVQGTQHEGDESQYGWPVHEQQIEQ